MSLEQNVCYEFGDFILDPSNRLLRHLNRGVNLTGKDINVLIYLVEHGSEVVSDQQLIGAIWGVGSKLDVSNISKHISTIRRALNCDPRAPRFIKTYHKRRSYRFIAEVKEIKKPGYSADEAPDGARSFVIEANLFSPVFLGSAAFGRIGGVEKGSQWASYKEFPIDGARLCVFSSGIGVWHLTERREVNSFAALAQWRLGIYRAILAGKHRISIYTARLKDTATGSADPLKLVVGVSKYVVSLLVLSEPQWLRPERFSKPLRLLSCLTPLEGETSGAVPESGRLERELLDGTYANVDSVEFGSPGIDIGFANWDGVSYLARHSQSAALKTKIAEFEIAVQSAWWLAKCIVEEVTNGSASAADLELAARELRRQYGRIKAIGPTESTAERTMTEAILKTSRLDRLIGDALLMLEEE
ncbi:MAG: winged helix-turn-helix domain-containing protein [Pyrinomonadaceae bacterium]